MRQQMSFVSQGLIAAVILAVGAGIWFAREPVAAAVAGLFTSGGEQTGKSRRGRRGGRKGGVVPVVVQRVASGRNDLAFAGIGTARALRHVTLYPAVSGEILKVYTRAGDRIAAGAKIMELDVRQAELAVEMARSKLQGAKRMLGRADRLRRQKVQSKAKVQDAETLADQAEVELKTAQVTLTDHTIKAPFAGIVGIETIEVGDRVTPTTALVTLDDRSKLTVEFDVPEQYLPRLRRGMSVDVRTPGFANRKFAGVLSGIDSRVHPTKRIVVVRAEVGNGDDLLRPGMSFAVDMKLPGTPFPQIPDLALQFSQRGNYVWLIEDAKAKRVPVKIVRRDANTVLVEGRIKAGDRIVIEGVQRLRPGRNVQLAEAEKSTPTKKTGAKVN